jgi:hypothetical protein
LTDLTLDKVKSMLGAHNDGVFRLETRDNLGEIVGWLVGELEAAKAEIESAPSPEEIERKLRDAIDRQHLVIGHWITFISILAVLWFYLWGRQP